MQRSFWIDGVPGGAQASWTPQKDIMLRSVSSTVISNVTTAPELTVGFNPGGQGSVQKDETFVFCNVNQQLIELNIPVRKNTTIYVVNYSAGNAGFVQLNYDEIPGETQPG